MSDFWVEMILVNLPAAVLLSIGIVIMVIVL